MKDPLPLFVRKTTEDTNIVITKTRFDQMFALHNNGKVDVYTRTSTGRLERPKSLPMTNGINPYRGFDVDSSGVIWTFDSETNDLVRVDSLGNLVARTKPSTITDTCWQPVDIATTCDGLLIVADACDRGRFFVLEANDRNSMMLVKQFNDGGMFPETPIVVTTGLNEQVFFVGQNYVTVYQKNTLHSPFQYVASWKHGVQSPKQVHVDQTGQLYMTCSRSLQSKFHSHLFLLFQVRAFRKLGVQKNSD